VLDLEQVFMEDWAFATDEKLAPSAVPPSGETDPAGRCVVSVVPSGPDQERNASEMVYFAGVASARARVYLTSPYFIPGEPMLYALTGAALRGVDVRLLVPARPDVALVGAAARSYHRQLIRAGVRIFEYLPSMLHAKTLVADGVWGMVGSANLDLRSFRLNFELGAVVHDAGFAEELEQRFVADLEQSREVTPERLASRSRLRRLGDGVAWLFSPLL
jgi:cardiolipin synthase